MVWFDYAILAVLFFSIFISVLRGFIKEAISLSGWVIGLWAAAVFSEQVAQLIAPFISAKPLRFACASLLLFLGVLIVFALINFIVSKLVSSSGLKAIDVLAGMIFGLIRGILVIVVIILVARSTGYFNYLGLDSSVIAPYLTSMVDWLDYYFLLYFEPSDSLTIT